MNVADQFQVGDTVLFVEQGIITKVVGYVWHQEIGSLPKVISYQLACGVDVPYDAIVIYVQ